MAKIVYTVSPEDEEIRIDKYLTEQSEEKLTRSYIQKLIKDGRLFVNEQVCKSNYRVRSDDEIVFDIPESIEPEILPEDIPLDILYEDEDVILINKPKGMVVHPAAGHYTGTVVNALLYHCKDLSGINGILRPGIVHRIDKDTSGVIICAKNDFSHKNLAEQLKDHTINRIYEAIVVGKFKEPDGTITGDIGRSSSDRKKMAVVARNGKPAITHYHVISEFAKTSFVECKLETGRTHQIRVHMAYKNHPLLGDILYGGKNAEYKLHGESLQGQTLHAKVFGFKHPRTNEYMEFEAERPQYFDELLEIL
ncbi:MAG: RluA family pseudouridine synthase [Lachnospiraceae bacterium]|nr:RluA family pseudouridine synthase [Lachnospiraceae bacterium]